VIATLRADPGTRSAIAERVSHGYCLNFDVNREAIARHGLPVMDVGLTKACKRANLPTPERGY